MNIDLIFKIAAIGIIVAILNQVLSRSGRDEQATMTTLAGLVVVLMMVAQVTGLRAGEFIHTTGDTHLYLNHTEQVAEQLSRTPRKLPTMRLNPEVKSVFDFRYEDFTLEGYDPYPAIKAPMSF